MNRATTTKNLALWVLLVLAASGCRFSLFELGELVRPHIPIVEHHPDNPHALFFEGKAYLADGKSREAAASFRNALREQPGFIEARLGLAHALRERGYYRRACAQYRRVLEELPSSVQALEGLAIAENHLGRAKEAEETFLRALAIAPRSVSTLNALAEFYYGRENYGKALKYWGKSLEVDKDQEQIRVLVDDLRGYVKKYGPIPPSKKDKTP